MDCSLCQELISEYIDGETDQVTTAHISAHIAECGECSQLFEDFSAILANCAKPDTEGIVPPNPKALWCRINNVIESDLKHREKKETPAGWFGKARAFSVPQVVTAALGVALISSLLTVVGLKNYFEPTLADNTTRSRETETTVEKLLGKLGLIEGIEQARERRVREQQAVIDYWNKRVQAKRIHWDERMREAFDRNVREIDQAVHEYTLLLEKDPDDHLTGEMLDSALNEKMNLLREFAEL